MMYGEQCGHRRPPHPVGTVVVVVVPWDDMLCLSRFFEVLLPLNAGKPNAKAAATTKEKRNINIAIKS